MNQSSATHRQTLDEANQRFVDAFGPLQRRMHRAGDPIGLIIGRMLACIVGLMVVLYLLNKHVLAHLFRLYAVTDMMLFIATFAYALGES